MEKDFKTITLRDLDKNPEIVRILNEVIQSSSSFRTGQKAIEYVIVQYQRQIKDINRLHNIINGQEREHYFKVKELEDENKRLKEAQEHARKFFKLFVED